jgi:hypothetical protein
MVRSSRNSPPGDAALPTGTGNVALGSLSPAARARRARRAVPLRDQMDALYHDTIRISEAARRWFDGPGRLWREELPPEPALAAALECLAVTTRLLGVMNWLLHPQHQSDDPAEPLLALQPVPCPLPQPLPADHPLLSDDGGGPIVRASREVLARAHTLANAHGERP